MGAFLAGLIGGIFSGIAIQYFRISAEYRTRQVDELVSDILKAAELGTQYWHALGSSDGLREKEDILRGMQHRLTLVVHDIYPELETRAPEVEIALAEFFGMITGGAFGDAGRPTDGARSFAGQGAAATLILAVRRARQEYSPFPRSYRWTLLKWWAHAMRAWRHVSSWWRQRRR